MVQAVSVIPPLEEYSIKIGNISAINATTLEVVIPVTVTVTEKDLTDKKVTLKGGEKDLVATYKANSLANGKATFVLSGEDKLVDAVNYTATADWATFTKATFVAKIAISTYIKTVEVSTTKVPANTAVSDKNLVSFTAKNQYGEALDLAGKTAAITVKGTLNGVPLLTDELNITNIAQGKIEINKDLVEGNTINLVFTNEIGGQAIQVGTASYKVAAAEASVPTTISNLKSTYKVTANGHTQNQAVTEVIPNDEITLTANIKDQFGNTLTGADAKVRWAVETGLENIDNSAANIDLIKATGVVDADETLNLKVIKAGKIALSGYLANGTKVSYEITAGSTKLAAFAVANIAGNNNEEVISTEITGITGGAVLNASDIKFAITELPQGATASDITLTAVNGTTDATKDKIYVKTTTLKPGTYKFKAYIGTTVDAENTVVANAGVANTVTTQVNQTAASMEVEAIGENELTAGTTIKKAVTFKNKHNEVISVNAKDITVAKTANMIITAYDKDGNVLTIGTTETPVAKLGFSGATEGVDTITLVTGSVSKQIQTTTIKAAGLNKIEIATATAVINGDTYIGQDNDLKVVAGGVLTYTLLPVTFKDQYGNKIDVATNSGLKITGIDGNYNTAFFKAGDNDAARTKITDGTAVAYIGFATTGLTDADLPTTKELTVTNEAATPVTAKVTVTVNKARTLDKLTVTPTSASTVVGAKQSFVVSGVDQYGVAFDLDATKVKTIVAANGEYIVAPAQDNTDTNKVNFEIAGVKAGSYTVKVFYDANNASGLEATEKSIDIPMTIKELGDAITSLSIGDTAEVTPQGVTKYTADLAKYAAQLVKSTANNTIALTTKAYDKDNNEVAFNNTDLIWTVKSVDVKGATATLAANKVTVANGVITVGLDGITEDVNGKIIIKATTLSGISIEKTINVNSAAVKEQAGTYYLAKAGATDKALTSIALDKDDANGVEEVVLVAKDQYGKELNVIENTGNIVLGQDSSVFFDKVADADSINITAKAVGSSTLRVFASGDQVAALTITVDQVAVDHANAQVLTAADQAVENAVAAYEAKVAATYTGANFAATEKTAAENAITAYKALATDADDAKYDARKTAADGTNTTKQADYDNQAAVDAEVAKYESTVTIANNIATATDVTSTVKALKATQQADGGITAAVTAVKAQDGSSAATYLALNAGVITLSADNATASDVVEKVTITFTKGGKTSTLVVDVTVNKN